MKNKVLVILALIIMTVVVLASLGYLPLAITVNTTTTAYKYFNNNFYGIIPPELTDETDLVTAWKTGGNSVKLVVGGASQIRSDLELGVGRYFYQIYIVDQDHPTPYPIMWYNNYNRDYIHITAPTTGFFGMDLFAGHTYVRTGGSLYTFDPFTGTNIKTTIGCDASFPPIPMGGATFLAGSYGIEIKNPHVGKLIVQLWCELANSLANHDQYPYLMLQDEVKLLDGTGKLSIRDAKTVYEEEQTIHFLVDTGYSGKRQGGEYADDGWELRVYDAKGTRRQTWTIADDQHGIDKAYLIPDGAYDSTGYNTWKVELWNTLFNQYETYFFTIGKGMTNQIPGMPTITFDKTYYNMGDICYATIVSVPNSQGRNTINEFFVRAYYQDEPINYLYGPVYVKASGNQIVVSFSLPKGDRNCVVEANAFDAPHDQGGLASETGKRTVFVKDKNPLPNTYTLTVNVLNIADKIPDAIVDIGSARRMTDANGQAVFIGLVQNTYVIQVSKDGFNTATKTMTLDSDKSVDIQLSKKGDILPLIIAIVIFAIFCVAGILIPVPLSIKILIWIIGLISAIISYLYFSGLI